MSSHHTADKFTDEDYAFLVLLLLITLFLVLPCFVINLFASNNRVDLSTTRVAVTLILYTIVATPFIIDTVIGIYRFCRESTPLSCYKLAMQLVIIAGISTLAALGVAWNKHQVLCEYTAGSYIITAGYLIVRAYSKFERVR